MKFKQTILAFTVGFLTITSITPIFAKDNLFLTDDINANISQDSMYKTINNYDQTFNENNSDFIIIERATGEIEKFVLDDLLDEIIYMDELNVSTDNSLFINNDLNSNIKKDNTQEISQDMRQTYSINWDIPGNSTGYGETIFTLRAGDTVSYRITPANSANIQVGLYNRINNTFNSAWSHTGVPAGWQVSESFTLAQGGTFSFAIRNNNNTSNQFLGNFSI